MILSTGMANADEINETLEIVRQYGCGDYMLLHCVSGYPTPVDEINLKTINLMRENLAVRLDYQITQLEIRVQYYRLDRCQIN